MKDGRPRIDFAAEAAERLEAIRSILEAGREPRISEINELFRAVHSLKGLAGLAGYEKIGTAFHEAENLLDSLRLSRLAWSADLADGLNRFLRLFERRLGVAEEDRDAGFPLTDALDVLRSASAPAVEAPAALPPAVDLPAGVLACLSEFEESRLRVSLSQNLSIYAVDASFLLEEFETGLKALGARLNEAGEWIATLPQAGGFTADRIGVQLLAAATAEPAGLPAGSTVRRIGGPVPAAPEPAAPRAVAVKTVRMEAARLEELLSAAETAQAEFSRLEVMVRSFERRLAPGERVRLARCRQQTAGAIAGLARLGASIRTVPLAALADRLRRAMERVLRASAKSATLSVVGGDVEIDRSLADELADPLLHLVRNAVDHGIESREQRRAAGKTEEGRITLMARSRHSRLLLSIADDGRGVEENRVLRRARELGWIGRNARPPREELMSYLFRPGFSTASAVSQTSGRGVGLDLVADRVGARGGVVQVVSEEGRGCRFEIEVPNAHAAFDAIVVAEGDGEYAFPLAAVARIEPDVAGWAIPRLDKLLGRAAAGRSGGARHGVVLRDGSAISVDRVLREEMIIVRSVDREFAAPFLIGASEGRGGKAILVFDPKRLLRDFAGSAA